MNTIKAIFFGSTSDSVIVLNQLHELRITDYELQIVTTVTQPPRPVGRKQEITPTPVQTWAEAHNILTLSFASDTEHPARYADEQIVVNTLAPFQPDIIISASYGQKIPTETLRSAKYAGLNIHPSLLPRWRGADPVPWAILSGDHQTGVSVVTLSEAFDQGRIIAQKKLPIMPHDTSDPLRTKLFELGANLLVEHLLGYISGKTKGTAQDKSGTPYARRFTRQDGFEPWETIQKALTNPEEAVRIERKFRAFLPWPGVWTEIATRNKKQETGSTKKRLKILACHLSPDSCLMLDTVQLEGKTPISYREFMQTQHLS
jgi:methionyl-tRNA formyltransferase